MSADSTIDGQVALITGASGGIGRALAVGLSGAGMAVGLLGRNLTRLDATLRELVEAGGKGVAFSVDVTAPEEVGAAVEAIIRDLGPIDLLVNNAARIEKQESTVWETDPKEWWAVVETNLRGPFLLSRAVLPGMVERGGGRIVNLNTGLALRNEPYYSAYAASKAALFRLSGAIAAAGAPYGVRSFEVSPGIVPTPMATGMPMHAGRTEWTPLSAVVELVVAIAQGRLDDLSGRYMRAGADQVEDLRAWAGWIVEQDARTLRLRPYGTDDPLA
jgi:NAD(P)-dependent dehydrogenase (short-subunit alcohol dehydrogenase family)